MPIHIAAWCDSFAARGISCPEDFIQSVTGMPADDCGLQPAVPPSHRCSGLCRRKEPPGIGTTFRGRADRSGRRYRQALPGDIADGRCLGGTRDNVFLTLDVLGLADCSRPLSPPMTRSNRSPIRTSSLKPRGACGSNRRTARFSKTVMPVWRRPAPGRNGGH